MRKNSQILLFEVFCLCVVDEMFIEVALFQKNLTCPEKYLVAPRYYIIPK